MKTMITSMMVAGSIILGGIGSLQPAKAQSWAYPAMEWWGANAPAITQRLPYYGIQANKYYDYARQYGPQVYGFAGGPLKYQSTPPVQQGYTYYPPPQVPSYRPAMPSFGSSVRHR